MAMHMEMPLKSSCFTQKRLGCFHTNIQTRQHARSRIKTRASLDAGPAYNKYRSRRQIEDAYFKDWAKTTIMPEEEMNRPMTIFTFMSFLPAWFKFYGLPGPLRFLCFLVWRRISAVLHEIHKKLIIQGAKIDRHLIQKNNLSSADALPMRLVLYRYHHRISASENVKYRLSLLKGKVYTPKVSPNPLLQN